MKHLTFILVGLAITSTPLWSQRPLDVNEVRIVAPYEPSISDAFKINDNPSIDDTKPEKPAFAYSIVPRKLETKFALEPMRPAQINEPALAALNHGHLKVGFGTQATPYAELFVNSNRSKTHALGLNVRHFSTLSSISDRAYSGFSENRVNLFGTYFLGENLLKGGLYFNHDRLHFYGFDPTDYGFAPHGQKPQPGQLELTKDKYNQKLTRLSANIGIKNRENSSSKIVYRVGFDYKFFADKYQAKEHLVAVSGRIGNTIDGAIKTFENPVISLDLDAKFFKNIVQQKSFSSSLVSLVPGIGYKGSSFSAFAGVDAIIKVDSTKTSLGVYPNLRIEADLIDQYLMVYGKLSGGLKQQSLDDLTGINPFLNTSSQLMFENTKVNITGGVKGIFNDNLSYNLSFNGARIQNFAFFATDLQSQFQNKFLAIYDTITRIGVFGEIFSSFGPKAQARLSAAYYQYTMKNELMPWNLPEMELSLNTKINLAEDFSITADFFGRSKAFARIIDVDNTVIGRKLHDFVVDFNIGAGYKISPYLSAFIQLQNVTGKSFERWINYPTRGLNIFGGVGWSF